MIFFIFSHSTQDCTVSHPEGIWEQGFEVSAKCEWKNYSQGSEGTVSRALLGAGGQSSSKFDDLAFKIMHRLQVYIERTNMLLTLTLK